MKNFHKNMAPATFGFAVLFLMCSSLWSSQTESTDTLQATTRSMHLVCSDFNKVWFGDNNNFRLLYLAENNQRYSMACYVPEDSELEGDINDICFDDSLQTWFSIDYPTVYVFRQIIENTDPFKHSQETWSPFTLDVFEKYIKKVGRRFVKWKPIKQENFLEAVAQRSTGLFMLVKNKGIIYGKSMEEDACVVM